MRLTGTSLCKLANIKQYQLADRKRRQQLPWYNDTKRYSLMHGLLLNIQGALVDKYQEITFADAKTFIEGASVLIEENLHLMDSESVWLVVFETDRAKADVYVNPTQKTLEIINKYMTAGIGIRYALDLSPVLHQMLERADKLWIKVPDTGNLDAWLETRY